MKNLISIPFLIIVTFASWTHSANAIKNGGRDLNNYDTDMKTIKTFNKKFIGSWELKEWTAELNDGSIVHPFGKDAIGRITYDGHSNMAVQIMKNNRPNFLSEDPLQGQPDEVVTAYGGFIAYCGTFEVLSDANQVVHKIAISSFPNWVGQDQFRNYEFKDDNLILSTNVIGSSRHRLVWEKMNK
ncbi:MAG: lipocalin-like domain-containing protein [Saprospiraceae bacterium]|nr:lipocalin-like domain-containing protein [Saprospiraceae bacterium]